MARGSRSSAPWAAKAIFGLSCAAWIALSLARATPPFHPLTHPGFFDLKIYRGAGSVLLHGHPLYTTRIRGFVFTYPPLAALAFAPLSSVPVIIDEFFVTAINLALLVAIIHWALRLATPARSPRDEATRAWLTWVGAAAALWSEPVISAIGYGQIDLVVAALVLYDLTRDRRSPAAGIALGIAVGLKLTPLIFVVYLLLGGRLGVALRAAASFAVTVAAGFLVSPRDARVYWGGDFLRTSRITGRAHSGAGPANQSLHGLLMRIVPSLGAGTLYVALAAAVAAVGLALAVGALRGGDEATGFSLTAVTGLLVSPISWTHHWAIAVPALVILVARAIELRSAARGLAALALVAVAGSYAVWLVVRTNPTGVHLDASGLLAGDLYVLAGLAALAVAAIAAAARGPRHARYRAGTLVGPVVAPARQS